jgi:hypothetical protein
MASCQLQPETKPVAADPAVANAMPPSQISAAPADGASGEAGSTASPATLSTPNATDAASSGQLLEATSPSPGTVVRFYVTEPTHLQPGHEKLVAPEPARHLAFEVDAPSCAVAAGEAPLKARLPIASWFGAHVASLALTSTPAGELVTVDIDGQHLFFSGGDAKASGPSTRRILHDAACAAIAQKPGSDAEAVLDTALADTLRDWTQLIAPDCEVRELRDAKDGKAGGWVCSLPMAEPKAAEQELIGIRTTMIRRWSRQPYLLARRLAVALNLSQALQARDADHALDTFCNVARHSLTAELPATVSSNRWQAVACKPGPDRFNVGMFGLAKAVAEIDFMRQLFERTSKLGSLTVRIPSAATTAHQFLVSLTPEADVAENLTRETARLWTTDASVAAAIDDLPRACWHPVFAEDEKLLRLARNLAMAGDAPSVECDHAQGVKDTDKEKAEAISVEAALERYFAESITSETEFVLPNGRSKTLRLPTGRYSYTLQALPDNPEEWDDAAQSAPTAKGLIIWDVQRPRPVIGAWEGENTVVSKP